MQPFIKFISDNTFISSYKDKQFGEVIGCWKKDCDSAFNALSPVGKCKHLVRQALMVNFVYRVYHNEPWFLFIDYRDQLLRWAENTNQLTDVKDPMIADALRVTRMLLNPSYSDSYLFPSINDMSVFLDSATDTEKIPSIADKDFYIPYYHFVNKTSSYKPLESNGTLSKDDDFRYPIAAIPKLSFMDNYVFVEYQKVPEYHFDPTLLNRTTDMGGTFFKNFFSYLLCMDWSEMNLSQVLALISNYALVLDTNAIEPGNIALVYNKLWRNIFNYSGNIPVNIVCDIVHLKQIMGFVLLLRNAKKIKIDDPKLLADLVGNGERASLSEDEKLLVDYLEKVQSTTETSMEEYHAFKRSIFGCFEELEPSPGKRL